MERKGVTSTVAVTTEEVRSALPKSRAVTSEEEKALRMRYGVGEADVHAPLPRADGGNEELKDELLLLELQLLKSYRAHLAQKGGAKAAAQPARSADPASARAKDKIVRALRKKK